jgi:hypothetical protein
MSWFVTSVSPSISGMVESISSVAHVWKVLTGMYFGAGSVMMMMEVEEKIDVTTQGEKSTHHMRLSYKVYRRIWITMIHWFCRILLIFSREDSILSAGE